MEDYSERNLRIIEEAMQELGISDCEEIPAAIRLLKQQRRPTKRALDAAKDWRKMDFDWSDVSQETPRQ